MHVLIIPSSAYLIEEQPLAGIFQRHQAHALRRSGIRVGVAAIKPRWLRLMGNGIAGRPTGIVYEDDAGVPVYRFEGWDWTTGRMPCLTAWRRVHAGMKVFDRYVINQGPPDVVHAHNALYAGVLAARIKEEEGIPCVLTEHSSGYLRGSIRRWEIPVVEKAYANADARITVGRSLGNVLEARFGEAFTPWECIPNVLDKAFEDVPIERKTGGRDGGPFRFLNIAGLDENKNHANLITAFSEHFRGRSDVRLRIGGDGPLREELVSLTRELEVEDQVKFLGTLTRDQVHTELSACDAFVLSSNHETFGVILIEAMACGKPVVSTACGGPEEIVHEGNGVLAPPRDPAALGRAMLDVFERIGYFDSTAIRLDCIERFGEETVVEKLKAVYERVIHAD